jgi:hypothetical protein
MLNRLFILLIGIVFVGCEFAHEEKVVGKYYLVASDVVEDMNLGFQEHRSGYGTLVKATVFAVGFNDEFIIVKQHPSIFPYPPDNTITNYFIVPISSRMNPYEDIIGPLTKTEFETKKDELGIDKDLPFSIVLEDLE